LNRLLSLVFLFAFLTFRRFSLLHIGFRRHSVGLFALRQACCDALDWHAQDVGYVTGLDLRRHRHAGPENFLFLDPQAHFKSRGVLLLPTAATASTRRAGGTRIIALRRIRDLGHYRVEL